MEMDALIEHVYDKIKDFRNDEGVQITCAGIRDWALQFGDDAAFKYDTYLSLVI